MLTSIGHFRYDAAFANHVKKHFKPYLTALRQGNATVEQRDLLVEEIATYLSRFRKPQFTKIITPYLNLILDINPIEEQEVKSIFSDAIKASNEPFEFDNNPFSLSEEIKAILGFCAFIQITDSEIEGKADIIHQMHQWSAVRMRERVKLRPHEQLNADIIFNLIAVSEKGEFTKNDLFYFLKQGLSFTGVNLQLIITLNKNEDIANGVDALERLRDTDIKAVKIQGAFANDKALAQFQRILRNVVIDSTFNEQISGDVSLSSSRTFIPMAQQLGAGSSSSSALEFEEQKQEIISPH